jgi:hypothetical protein
VRHRQTKGSATDRLRLNHRATPRLHTCAWAGSGEFHLSKNAFGAPCLILLSNRENAMTALLELIPAVRTGIKYPGGSYKSERHFLDFAIDGQSLWEKLKKPDMVSVLCFEYAAQALDESMKAANRLLLAEKADHPHDRRSLFICSECGDLGCGAISCLIVREGDAVVWKEFGFQTNYEDNVDFYAGIGPFSFEVASYERTLLRAINSLTNGPTPE